MATTVKACNKVLDPTFTLASPNAYYLIFLGMHIASAMLWTLACTFKITFTAAMTLFMASTMTLLMAFAMTLKKYRCHL